MQYVSVWNVIQAMTINFEISEDERAESLRLHEDVIEVRNEGAPSPLKGVSMGEFRAQVVRNLPQCLKTCCTTHRNRCPPCLTCARQAFLASVPRRFQSCRPY